MNFLIIGDKLDPGWALNSDFSSLPIPDFILFGLDSGFISDPCFRVLFNSCQLRFFVVSGTGRSVRPVNSRWIIKLIIHQNLRKIKLEVIPFTSHMIRRSIQVICENFRFRHWSLLPSILCVSMLYTLYKDLSPICVQSRWSWFPKSRSLRLTRAQVGSPAIYFYRRSNISSS